MPAVIPYVPEQITVHLGPPNADAANVTLPFYRLCQKRGVF